MSKTENTATVENTETVEAAPVIELIEYTRPAPERKPNEYDTVVEQMIKAGEGAAIKITHTADKISAQVGRFRKAANHADKGVRVQETITNDDDTVTVIVKLGTKRKAVEADDADADATDTE